MHKLIWQLFISHHISDSLNYSRPAIPFVLLKLLIRTMCAWKIKLFVIQSQTFRMRPQKLLRSCAHLFNNSTQVIYIPHIHVGPHQIKRNSKEKTRSIYLASLHFFFHFFSVGLFVGEWVKNQHFRQQRFLFTLDAGLGLVSVYFTLWSVSQQVKLQSWHFEGPSGWNELGAVYPYPHLPSSHSGPGMTFPFDPAPNLDLQLGPGLLKLRPAPGY